MRYLFFMVCCVSLFLESAGQVVPETKKIKIRKDDLYLSFPVNATDPSVVTKITLNGEVLDRFAINLAQRDPQFYTYFDVSGYQGKTLLVEIEGTDPKAATIVGNALLGKMLAAATYPGQDSVYKEKDRPQIHFSAQRGWLNDPNGLLYHDGEYHLYFQHNPYGWQWGNMHWGHAVSADLLHWKQLKEAIYPVVKDGVVNDAAFSGTAIVDPANTAGFRKNGIDPIIAVYTSTGRGECIQLSYDKGRTFEDYSGNPVLKHNGRDPKVFWYEPGSHWVMVVWDEGVTKKLSLGQQVSVREHSVYTSSDLKNWTYRSGISGFFECPDLFELPVEGKPGLKKWVMYDANGRYIVGDFNGKEFTIEQHFTKYENGGGYFYAAQTYNHAPNNRRIQVGWGRDITHPGMPFNQAMLFPTELTLKMTDQGYRLCPTPIKEINSLHTNSQVVKDYVVVVGRNESLQVNPDAPIHVIAEVERGDAAVVLNILGYELRYDNEWIFSAMPPKRLKQENVQTPVNYASKSGIFKIEAIADKNILEFFINDGELYYVTAFNGKKNGTVEAMATGDGNRKFILKKLEVHELSPIWAK